MATDSSNCAMKPIPVTSIQKTVSQHSMETSAALQFTHMRLPPNTLWLRQNPLTEGGPGATCEKYRETGNDQRLDDTVNMRLPALYKVRINNSIHPLYFMFSTSLKTTKICSPRLQFVHYPTDLVIYQVCNEWLLALKVIRNKYGS